MHIKIVGIAFAIALLAMIGFAGFGTSGTAEATVHPISSGDCSGIDDPGSPQGGQPPGISGQANQNPTNDGNEATPVVKNGSLENVGVLDPIDPIAGEDTANPETTLVGAALNGDNGNCPNGDSEPLPAPQD